MFDPSMTIEIARLGVQTGAHPIYEIVERVFTFNIKPEKRLPISEYLSRQGRFSHLREKDIKYIQKRLDKEWSGIENQH
jgi:pyruvate ferredoxin oxidoreductase beta subunit